MYTIYIVIGNLSLRFDDLLVININILIRTASRDGIHTHTHVVVIYARGLEVCFNENRTELKAAGAYTLHRVHACTRIQLLFRQL